MERGHPNERGEYELPTPNPGDPTVIFDRRRNTRAMIVRGVVVLSVGAEWELTEPHLSSTVVGVRLLAPAASVPAMVRLYVEVPAKYWGDDVESKVLPELSVVPDLPGRGAGDYAPPTRHKLLEGPPGRVCNPGVV